MWIQTSWLSRAEQKVEVKVDDVNSIIEGGGGEEEEEGRRWQTTRRVEVDISV